MEETKRKLVSIQRIDKLEAIEGADFIERASVLGWHLVVKKGEFTVGDLCVYFEVDSFLPIRDEYSFLQNSGVRKMLINGEEKAGYRLKTIRLRGQISQGLALPISAFPELDRAINSADYVMLGADVTEHLGVYKYEIPLPAQLAGKVRGNFPGFLKKTDEPRLQAFPFLLEKYKDVPFYATEKIDGSSVTFVIKNDEFHVCSRSLDLLDDGKNTIWRVAKELKIEEKLRLLKEERYAIQGEIVGEKIQNNTLKISGHKIFFFSVYDFVKGEYLGFNEFREIMGVLGLPVIPIVSMYMLLPKTVDEAVLFATRKSVINPNGWAEGVVLRPIEEIPNDETLGDHVSFKVINPEFLLKNE